MVKKTHLVKWDVVCYDKKQASLDLRSQSLLNKALVGRRSWRFATNVDYTWKRLICSKFGMMFLVGRLGRPKGLLEWVFGRKSL